ncbi:hypothetical protein MtrunA17_Chr2g0282221 [Medicago truncatula]|uniref:Uncharacterized protein n=1 Tax=Medicago truncatula TaxID=3880 RepID=A0A396J1Q1_MEDTR|nr:hypothetical protein MtrunA17_Chr2g0282221 [Medicago truncatula]
MNLESSVQLVPFGLQPEAYTSHQVASLHAENTTVRSSFWNLASMEEYSHLN